MFAELFSFILVLKKQIQNIEDILIKNNNEIFLDNTKYGTIIGFDLTEEKKILSQLQLVIN